MVKYHVVIAQRTVFATLFFHNNAKVDKIVHKAYIIF